MTELTLAAIMTCHNRRDITLCCLENLFKQQGFLEQLKINCFLTDDGCNDGTSDEIRRTNKCVTILSGNGSLYWNGGMRLAWAEAMRHNHDFYLWLNDDTLLYPDAVQRLLETYHLLAAQGDEYHIISGSVQDGTTKEHTYGGVVRSSRWHPFKYKLVTPAVSEPTRCDTVNGNLALVPQAVAQRVGNLESAFTHGMGDFDYALRASAQGCNIWVAPGFYGVCSRNTGQGQKLDHTLNLRQRLKKINQPKGLPIIEWGVFARRHGGALWCIFWLMPYMRAVLCALPARTRASL
jgi:GT2 family glycosyltransferase